MRKSSHLPPDVVEEILSWLPVKSLLRFRCVSKAWLRLLTINPHFIKLHLHRSSLTSNVDIMVIGDFGNSFFSAEYDSCDKRRELTLPFEAPRKYYPIVGSCNGLFCVIGESKDNNSNVYLWNPCTRDHISIPCPPTQYHIFDIFNHFGFGFDQTNDEYKVVRIQDSWGRPSLVDAYSLVTDSWRSIEPPKCTHFQAFNPVLVNGYLHWIAARRSPSPCWNLIVCFSVKDEVFKELLQPCDVGKYAINQTDVTIGKLDGSLCLFLNATQDNVEIWVMKEYGAVDSWKKQFTIGRPVLTGSFYFLQPLATLKNGDIIIKKNPQHFILYDPKSNSIKKLKSFGFLSANPWTYVGSLVSPRLDNGVEHNYEESKFREIGGKGKRLSVGVVSEGGSQLRRSKRLAQARGVNLKA